MSGVVVFDVGGVLLDWSPYHLYRQMLADDAAIAAFIDEVGFNDWNVALDAGERTWDEAVALLGDRFPHRRELITAAHHRWHDMVRAPITGAVDILERLAAAGTPLYAITNFSSEKFREARERYAFLRRFRDVVVSGDERMLKPDPAIYHTLTSRNGLDPADCVFIDDSEKNVAGAKAIGMEAVRFTTAEMLASDLRARGHDL
jgi:2-haloacid dehalogenase